jgi:hypothetical protein
MTGLLSIVGTPAPILYATVNVVRTLTQIALGNHMVVVANSVAALREEFRTEHRGEANPLVLLSDYPHKDLLALLVSAKAPVAICVADFASVAHFSVASRDFVGVTAARFASMGLVNVEALVVQPPQLSLVINDARMKLTDLVSKLAALYHLPLDADRKAEVLELLGRHRDSDESLADYANVAVATPNDVRKTLELRSPLDNELIDFMARQYDGVAQGRRLERLEWPVYALLRPEFPDRLTIGPIDLTGPARFIYYGPSFALPVGAWSAEISMEVRDCLSDNRIAIDVYAGKILAVITAKLPPQGVYGCQIRFQIEDSSQPVDIRVQLMTGAIEGLIRMHRIVLHRMSTLDEAESGGEARKAAPIGV